MRKLLIISALTAAAMAAICAAEVAADAQVNYQDYPNPEFARMIDENPAIACLNACPYDLVAQPGPDTKAPRGYKPFYISHYGRHGSRSGWDQDKYEKLITALSGAKEAGILSASGDSLLHEVRLVKDATNKMDGRLTVRGQREHHDLADRMYKRYRRVFRRGSHNIRVLSSTVPRCLVSMAAFTNRLSELDSRLSIVMDCGEEIQKEISNEAGNDIRASRRHITDSLRNLIGNECPELMCRIFTDTAAARTFVHDQKAFSNWIFALGRISRSFDFDFDAHRYLPFGTTYKWAEYNNVYMYLGQCNSIPFGENRMQRTVPLVQNIVRLADDALASGEVAADLRFGHDYPLMALCSYLGVEGIGERYDVDGAREHFISTLYSPFAGNLQIVFYRARKGLFGLGGKSDKPVLVKFLLNEREVSIIGLEPVQGPYYDWEAFKAKISR